MKRKKRMHSMYSCNKNVPSLCVVLFYLIFRLLRLCFTILNLREDKGEKSKAIVLNLVPRNRTGNRLVLI
jgi:hypothetical protein